MKSSITLDEINPYVRAALIQPAVLEGVNLRKAYDYRLFYVLDGNGYFITAEAEYTIEKATLIIFPPGMGYYFRGKLRVAVLNFDITRTAANKNKPIFPPPSDEFTEENIFDSSLALGFDKLIIIPECHYIYDSLIELISYFDKNSSIADAVTSGILKSILSKIVFSSIKRKSPQKKLVSDILRYIELYAPQISDNSELGVYFGYHPVYLQEVFREKTGKTLHIAIIEARIKLAKRLLIDSDDSIEDIAEATGFSSRSHLSETFRKYTGTSPAKYRKIAKNNI